MNHTESGKRGGEVIELGLTPLAGDIEEEKYQQAQRLSLKIERYKSHVRNPRSEDWPWEDEPPRLI